MGAITRPTPAVRSDRRTAGDASISSGVAPLLPMKLRPLVPALLAALAAAAPAGFSAAPPPARPPNFIVILADDLGYGDLGCYGSETIATPHLDRLAREGMRFTDFYVASPFCSPSRAALLTGRLPARSGVPYVLFPAEHTGLPPGETTIAEHLRAAGYATALVGKWHLGWRRELRPTRQGFDEFFGLLHTNDTEEWRVGEAFRQLSSFEPLSLRDGDRVVAAGVDQATLTQQYAQRARDFIDRHRDRPFFLFLSHTMPHVPQYASPAFAGKSKGGLYGDTVEEIDASTGALMDHLRARGLAERTLVCFLSDNGATGRGSRPNPKARFPGRSFGGSNGPLRAGKGTTFEGGLRVPCLAWWPGTIAGGRVESAPASALDIFPTLARLAGAPVPPGLVLDGVDVSGRLTGREADSGARLLVHYFGVQLQAVREGTWKLFVPIAAPPATRVPSLWFEHQPGLFERQHRLWPAPVLYDLSRDPGESRDVAAENPAVVRRLLAAARAFDGRFQDELRPVAYLPGPRPPAPGQVRTPPDRIDEWRELLR